MDLTVVIKYLLPPFVGAVIGYFTNLIAVKMLFFPHTEKHIFGHRVPFTPGAIPKGKARLAKSAGKIVENELFTHEDISSKLLTDEVEKPLVERAMGILNTDIRDSGAVLTGSSDKYDKLEASFTELLTIKITEAIKTMDLPAVVRKEGFRVIRKHIEDKPLIQAFVTDQLIDRVMFNVGLEMERIIDERGPEMVGEITTSRIHDLGNRTPLHVLSQAGYDEEYVRAKIISAYREAAVNAVSSALKRIGVAQIVEDKINSMPVEELERGVLDIMKNELSMIVNLGALIGLVIGCINIFI